LLIDAHCHLEDSSFTEGAKAVADRARAAGVVAIINPGYDLESSKLALVNAGNIEGVYALVGIHPHDAKTADAAALEELERLLGEPGVVGIGEIGLDYYRDLSPRNDQMQAFRVQMDMARKHGLPVQIHNRDAHRDTLDVIREYAGSIPGIVLHCYSGSVEMARELLNLGCFISIAGPVTFANARKAADVARYVPLDRMLVETDSPYLAPTPHRGQRNEPAYVRYVAERIAEIKGVSFDEVAEATSAVAMRIFGISPAGTRENHPAG
jgi:TatD DNase family protein